MQRWCNMNNVEVWLGVEIHKSLIINSFQKRFIFKLFTVYMFSTDCSSRAINTL